MTRIPLRNYLLLILAILAALLAWALRPTISMADERPAFDIATLVPKRFGEWREQPTSAQIINPSLQQLLDELYSQILTRTYVNDQGYQIMLSITYGKNQSDSLQLHRPDVCYPAQGFALLSKEMVPLTLGRSQVPAMRLVTRMSERREPVTFWMVVGEEVANTRIDKKLAEMRYAMHNRIPDGILVRVSSIDANTVQAFEMQDRFATQLLAAIPPDQRGRFVGRLGSSMMVSQTP